MSNWDLKFITTLIISLVGVFSNFYFNYIEKKKEEKEEEREQEEKKQEIKNSHP